jgi:ABC-type Na+ efflux pump permease subunit
MAYEFRRWTSSWAVPVTLALPALAALHSVSARHAAETANAAEVEQGTLASTSRVTAFEAFGGALDAALPLVAVVVAGLASQSLAGELSRGTLRNLLLRPVRRFDALAGKFAALLVAALVAYAIASGTALAAAAHWFAFTDVAEVLPNGRTFVIKGGEASKMWPELFGLLAFLVAPLAACAGAGLAAGAAARTGVGGLAIALALGAPLVVFGVLDAAPIAAFLDTTRVISNARELNAGLQVLVPAAFTIVAVAVAALLLRRRSIP